MPCLVLSVAGGCVGGSAGFGSSVCLPCCVRHVAAFPLLLVSPVVSGWLCLSSEAGDFPLGPVVWAWSFLVLVRRLVLAMWCLWSLFFVGSVVFGLADVRSSLFLSGPSRLGGLCAFEFSGHLSFGFGGAWGLPICYWGMGLPLLGFGLAAPAFGPSFASSRGLLVPSLLGRVRLLAVGALVTSASLWCLVSVGVFRPLGGPVLGVPGSWAGLLSCSRDPSIAPGCCAGSLYWLTWLGCRAPYLSSCCFSSLCGMAVAGSCAFPCARSWLGVLG